MILSEEQITELHSRLKLTTVPNWKSLPGMSSQISALKTLLSDVFIRKHNETTLLLGPGGCCKHLLLDYCLHALEEEHSSTKPNIFSQGEYIRINLDGDYIDSDDDAFRVIARQLTAPMVRRKRMRNAQFKNMEFLELVLQEAQICDVPLLFVLNHFSSFCHQSKQTLLYTLLDLCSNKSVRICVVGLDRYCCITELLEKRIQSRFSQRQIILNYPSPTDIAQFVSATLFLPGTDAATKKWNSAVRRISRSLSISSCVPWHAFTPRDLGRVLLYAISVLPDAVADVNLTFWRTCFATITQQSTLRRNCTLSYLGLTDMTLLIAAKHFVQRKVANFCFLDLLESANQWIASARNYQLKTLSESHAWQSFQVLLQYGLVRYVGISSAVAGNNGRNENAKKGTANTVFRSGNEKNTPIILVMTPDEIDRIIRDGGITCPTVLENWALKWAA
ncbi:hypothetical protein WA577_006491 [Blastocystis sp. JDR]